jgi:hypothetical protein
MKPIKNVLVMNKITHKLNGFEFKESEHFNAHRVYTITEDSFTYPNETWVATVDDTNKAIVFCHGYFPNHPIGLKMKKYAEKIGYLYCKE